MKRNTIFIILFCVFVVYLTLFNSSKVPPIVHFLEARQATMNDSIRFDKAYLPYYIIRFSSNVDIMSYEKGWPYPLLYASPTRCNYNYSDLIQKGEREKGVIECSLFELIRKQANEYIYETVFYYDSIFWGNKNIQDTIYCKIFFIKFSSKIQSSTEMSIPKKDITRVIKQ